MYNRILSISTLIMILMLTACSEKVKEEQQQRPLQPIDVAEVLFKPVQSWHTYTTRIESPEEVFLMPRVSGLIESISFTEGKAVNAGDILFQLDKRPYTAIVASLESQIVSAKAALKQAESEANRAIKLAKRNAISAEETESRQSTLRQRTAEVITLEAERKLALLNVEFTEVRSPINGIVSRANITKGNNVLIGQTILTSIVSNQQMYAYFDIDERTWNQDFSEVTAESKQQVVMQRIGEKGFPHAGYINFIDNRINVSSGTLRVRATFENHEHTLRTGSFARIKLAANKITEQVIVPSKSIGTDLENKFVLIVGKDNVLAYKRVELGEQYGEFRAILSGLSKGDIIAVNGPARVGPGMPIKPNKIELNSDNTVFTLKQRYSQNLLVKK